MCVVVPHVVLHHLSHDGQRLGEDIGGLFSHQESYQFSLHLLVLLVVLLLTNLLLKASAFLWIPAWRDGGITLSWPSPRNSTPCSRAEAAVVTSVELRPSCVSDPSLVTSELVRMQNSFQEELVQ